MLILFDNTCYIFVQFIFPGLLYNAVSILHCKNRMDVNLCVRVCHDLNYFSSLISFLTELLFSYIFFYQHPVPNGTKASCMELKTFSDFGSTFKEINPVP